MRMLLNGCAALADCGPIAQRARPARRAQTRTQRSNVLNRRLVVCVCVRSTPQPTALRKAHGLACVHVLAFFLLDERECVFCVVVDMSGVGLVRRYGGRGRGKSNGRYPNGADSTSVWATKLKNNMRSYISTSCAQQNQRTKNEPITFSRNVACV